MRKLYLLSELPVFKGNGFANSINIQWISFNFDMSVDTPDVRCYWNLILSEN